MKIGFPVQAVSQFAHQDGQVERTQTREEAFPQRGQVVQGRDIGGDHFFQAGPLHLHDNVFPVRHGRLVYLGDGGGGQRRFAKRREQFRQRRAQFKFNRFPHCVKTLRRQLVQQQFQLIDIRVRQQVAAQCQDLAELEKGQPQFLEGFPHLFRRRPMIPAAQGAQKLVPGEHAQDLQQSRRRSQQTAFLRIDQYCHVFLPNVMCLILDALPADLRGLGNLGGLTGITG